MVNISTASYKTNEFKLVTIGKGGAGKKIRVNNILPGMVLTNITNKSSLTSVEYEKEEKKYRSLLRNLCYFRLFFCLDVSKFCSKS